MCKKYLKRFLSMLLLLSFTASFVFSEDVLVSLDDLESWIKELYILKADLQQKQIELDEWQSKGLLLQADSLKLQEKLDELQMEVERLLTELEVSEAELTKILTEFRELSEEWSRIQREMEQKIKNLKISLIIVTISAFLGGLTTGVVIEKELNK